MSRIIRNYMLFVLVSSVCGVVMGMEQQLSLPELQEGKISPQSISHSAISITNEKKGLAHSLPEYNRVVSNSFGKVSSQLKINNNNNNNNKSVRRTDTAKATGRQAGEKLLLASALDNGSLFLHASDFDYAATDVLDFSKEICCSIFVTIVLSAAFLKYCFF